MRTHFFLLLLSSFILGGLSDISQGSRGAAAQLGGAISNTALQSTESGLQAGSQLAGTLGSPNVAQGLGIASNGVGMASNIAGTAIGGASNIASASQAGNPAQLGGAIANTALKSTESGLQAGSQLAGTLGSPNVAQGLGVASNGVGMASNIAGTAIGGASNIASASQAGNPAQLGGAIANTALKSTESGLQAGSQLAGTLGSPNVAQGLGIASNGVGMASNIAGTAIGGASNIASASQAGNPAQLGGAIANTALQSTESGLQAGSQLAGTLGSPNVAQGLGVASNGVGIASSVLGAVGPTVGRNRASSDDYQEYFEDGSFIDDLVESDLAMTDSIEEDFQDESAFEDSQFESYYAVDDLANADLADTTVPSAVVASPSQIPAYVVGLTVIGSLVVLALFIVIVQLFILLNKKARASEVA